MVRSLFSSILSKFRNLPFSSQDVGGGSVKNGERNSLARIPLRWMIRECFNANSGIIFDAHMLKHEVGLDIENIFKAPKALSPETHHLVKPGSGELKGFTLSRIPIAIFSGLTSPFRWVGVKAKHLLRPKPSDAALSFDLPQFEYEGEAREELKDALSPIYDQLPLHWYWRLMEWIPCECPPSLGRVTAHELIRRLKGS